MKLLDILAVALACVGLTACVGTSLGGTDLPQGEAAYRLMPAASETALREYRIGPLDTLEITVFQEPDLSGPVQVDAGGLVALPLIGTVQGAGKTAVELSADIAARFGERYLRNPEVSVAVTESVSQNVSVQGQVVQPGVYDFRGQLTLLQALSLARGETNVAARDEVVVFRTINGQRHGALFDADAIRRGQAEDPELLANDIVVVGFSSLRGGWRDALLAAPLLRGFQLLVESNGGSNNNPN